MEKLKIEFVANDNISYESETKTGKQLGFITWGLSKLRIYLTIEIKSNDILNLSQEYFGEVSKDLWKKDDGTFSEGVNTFISKFKEPKIAFYLNTNKESKTEKVQLSEQNIKDGFVDIYVGGVFQKNALYGGASPQEKDIKLIVEFAGNKASVNTMIRVRRNANELTSKAIKSYVQSLSAINERDEEGVGLGIYSTDFFGMHIRGSKSIAHGTAVFLPWHRLYLIDLERKLQEKNPTVSLHYWKFDEAAPNIFQKDFLGKTIIDSSITPLMKEGFDNNFAQFNDNNPLKNWAIGREKLIRRKTWFNNQSEESGYSKGNPNQFHLKNEFYVYHRNNNKLRDILVDLTDYPFSISLQTKDPNDLNSFSGQEINPHGEAHTSINGFLNYVPTAPKDPLFFFLHSNVDRLWAKWQIMTDNFDAYKESSYPNFDKSDWKNVNQKLWPWKKTSTPNEFQMLPPGTRANNFTRSLSKINFEDNTPEIADAIDAFGCLSYFKDTGLDYDDSSPFQNDFNDSFMRGKREMFLQENNIVAPNLIQLGNNRILSKIISEKDDVFTQHSNKTNISLSSLIDNSVKSFVEKSTSKFLNLESESSESYINLDDLEQYFTDIRYLNAVHEYDITLLSEVEHQFDILALKLDSNTKISKALIVYILSVMNNEKIENNKILSFITNNSTSIFELIDSEQEEYIDLLITLLSFASNTTIRKIASITPTDFINSCLSKSKKIDKINLSNKYWALSTLFLNAEVKA